MYAIVCVLCVLGARLFWMQIIEGSYYKSEADGNRIRHLPVQAARGVMFDRNGQIVQIPRLPVWHYLRQGGKQVQVRIQIPGALQSLLRFSRNGRQTELRTRYCALRVFDLRGTSLIRLCLAEGQLQKMLDFRFVNC